MPRNAASKSGTAPDVPEGNLPKCGSMEQRQQLMETLAVQPPDFQRPQGHPEQSPQYFWNQFHLWFLEVGTGGDGHPPWRESRAYQQEIRDDLNPLFLQEARSPRFLPVTCFQDLGHEQDELTHWALVHRKLPQQQALSPELPGGFEDDSRTRKT